jgi:hypothetical protein
MKKVTFLVMAFAGLTMISCSKERTCSCRTTETNTGVDYDYYNDPFNGGYTQTSTPISETEQSTDEMVYGKVSKKFGNQNCPKSYTSVDPYDYTYIVSNGILSGEKGQWTSTTTCELK